MFGVWNPNPCRPWFSFGRDIYRPPFTSPHPTPAPRTQIGGYRSPQLPTNPFPPPSSSSSDCLPLSFASPRPLPPPPPSSFPSFLLLPYITCTSFDWVVFLIVNFSRHPPHRRHDNGILSRVFSLRLHNSISSPSSSNKRKRFPFGSIARRTPPRGIPVNPAKQPYY